MIKFIKQKINENRMRKVWATRDDESFEKYYVTENENRKIIKKSIEKLKARCVYEYGCYSGPNLKNLSCDIYGSDINEKAIEYARQSIPAGKFICTSEITKLNEWLPKKINVSIVNAVFYTMSEYKVKKILEFLFIKSEYLIIGDNLKNYDGEKIEIIDGNNLHTWKKIISPLGKIEDRILMPHKDYSLNELMIIKSKIN